MTETILLILGIAVLTYIGSGIGTLTGFGTSTIMVPVLVLFLPLPTVLLLVGIIHWFTDIWKIGLFKEGIEWHLILLFGVPGIITTYLSARLVFELPLTILTRLLGLLLIFYVLYLLYNPKSSLPRNKGTALAGGAIYGVLAGIFGIGGAVRGAFLTAYNLPKSTYIATTGAISLAIDTTRITTYIDGGASLTTPLLIGLLIFIPTSYYGSKTAEKIVRKTPKNKFRKIIAIFLLIIGIQLLIAPTL
ncbi:sulfite exporter TauE/SafE family protein [Methanonatronarchaeum sp. AMET-Sl]|uniref:sulfite exporter TauE/SafE family protein n=1 Tax=Methanonatronarchaeum sp. AMET-Sl TaxID=3037654 RepID=UPI00244DABBD|nr:sulfite exporter TauE/SafE family protein [Methanonatronarchaeum sp. AMET-Sl]WGI18034.1 sulfite exporter TauE/SafE family protein [Methanonatronarchaeum sp. AMET-Sl]